MVVQLDTSAGFTAAQRATPASSSSSKSLRGSNTCSSSTGIAKFAPTGLSAPIANSRQTADLAAVCGRRREHFPHRSIYNALIDMEWDTPVGPTQSVGGDALFRVDAFTQVKGFDPTVMAGEEPELCMRLRHAGWRFRRVACEMTLHDAFMFHFAQWWKRQVRGGYGACDVYTRFESNGERLFAKPTRSARIWCLGWPIAVLLGAVLGFVLGKTNGALLLGGLVFLAPAAQAARLSLGALNAGVPRRFHSLTEYSLW